MSSAPGRQLGLGSVAGGGRGGVASEAIGICALVPSDSAPSARARNCPSIKRPTWTSSSPEGGAPRVLTKRAKERSHSRVKRSRPKSCRSERLTSGREGKVSAASHRKTSGVGGADSSERQGGQSATAGGSTPTPKSSPQARQRNREAVVREVREPRERDAPAPAGRHGAGAENESPPARDCTRTSRGWAAT